jgi:hypothetical protein
MDIESFAAGAPAASPAPYEPGVCNIGPAEIARRRLVGHLGLGASIVLLGGLVAVGAPPLARLVLVVPAGVAASGYLQAALGFCAGFGARGVFNFGDVGPTTTVADAVDRARDRRRSLEINLASLTIGAVVALVAALLPA